MTDKISIAAIGDVTKVSTFSGTPYYFLDAAKKAGWKAEGWKIDLEKININRNIWNLGKLLTFQQKGGYQYSEDFAKRVIKQIPVDFLKGNIISFNQHFPPADAVVKNGGKIYHYIDATFSQLLDRYEIGKIIGKKIADETLKREKEFFQAATHIVGMQQWAANSVINDYQIPKEKVSSILPGANIVFPDNYAPAVNQKVGIGKTVPLVLGFVGKDWKRKGLELIIAAAEILQKKKYKVQVSCAGNAPDELLGHPLLNFAGFIDKSKTPEKFIHLLQSCDIGCLFSKAEFSSISVLEFIRAAVPVAGYVVDGMGDLYLEEASIRFQPTQTAEEVAASFITFIEDDSYRLSLQKGAASKSSHVTWDRAVKEWEKIIK